MSNKKTYFQLDSIRLNTLNKTRDSLSGWTTEDLIGLAGGALEIAHTAKIANQVVGSWPGSKNGIPVKYWPVVVNLIHEEEHDFVLGYEEIAEVTLAHIRRMENQSSG